MFGPNPHVDKLWVLDQGYGGDYDASISVPRPILASLGLDEGQPITLRVSDDAPKQVELLGHPTPEATLGLYTFEAVPSPTAPFHFEFRFPQPWLERHRLIPEEERDEDVDGPYRMIDDVFDMEQAGQFLKDDGTMVIPLGR